MTRYLLTGAAALALMTGAAMAQFASSSTTTTTQSVAPSVVPLPPLAPAVPSAGTITSTSHNERTVNENGVVVEKSQSYKNDGLNASSTSHVETRAPDGSEVTTTRKEWSQAPTSVTTSTSRRSVTTTEE